MQNNLFLRHLTIVAHDGKIAYDETFHRGVNIIHGQNSSGKSTIVRFIFYALGGSYADFVPEALLCSHVIAEVELNNRVYTLKRYLERGEDGIQVKKTSSMYIYFGSIEECKEDKRPEKWQCFGYNTTSIRRSFSNVLFELMGMPEIREGSNITMHQILRLIYLDQESPLSSLFFFEQFDQSLTRETVAELLMGLYDGNLSDAKLSRIKLEDHIEELKQAIKITRQFLDDPIKQSPAFIQLQIENLKKEMDDISEEVRSLREGEAKQEINVMEYERMRNQVVGLREQYKIVNDEIARLKSEIQDSSYFIQVLQKKIEAIDRSIDTRDYFDKLHLEYCPECLTKINDSVEEGRCRLCKSPIDNSKGMSQAMRIKLELQFQIRESQKLLEFNNEQLKEKNAQALLIQRELAATQEKYDYAVRNVRSTRDEQIDKLIQTKGYKEGEIAQFNTLLEYAEKYERLVHEQRQAEEDLAKISHYISAAESRIRKQRSYIERAITENGIYLLQHDQDRQAEFRNATDMKLDFGQNIVYLTDRHIKLSASSSFYLKMAARFAFFLSSVQHDSMMYPRLLLSDNMEDKGLEENRSRNFQHIVVKRLAEIGNPDFQVIFATSNIAKELDSPEYTVGDYYTKDNKSLKL